ncbi:23S rRNA pseudouridine1911/1915/1917 synthase [Alkalibacillus flavidus]|uniref:Pseudouridine synthase n=1 Tax=Alkalibacillus flavidus TaxID=546021 RepID=A0ABV2KUV5_9BACI
MSIVLSWTVERKYDQWLVREYLLDVRAFSSRLLKRVKQDGKIDVGGRAVTVRERLRSGDVIQVTMPEEPRSDAVTPYRMSLEIVYVDNHVLIVNKPRGMAVTPNMNDRDQATLANGVLHYFNERGIRTTPHIVTRLDRYTSGLVLIAKHSYAHHLLQMTDVKRWYTAVVEGELYGSGTLSWPIARHLPSIIERTVSSDGKEAVTHYWSKAVGRGRTCVQLELETGRTHQIRVHFAHFGYPLVGDDLYGRSSIDITGQALHAQWLSFVHPFTLKRVTAYARLPAAIQALL